MNSRKTIGFVFNSSWNCFNFRQPLIRDLRSVDYRIVLFSPNDKWFPLLHDLGCEVQVLKHMSRNGTNPVKDLALTRELIYLFRKFHIDLAIGYTIKPNIYGCIAANYIGIHSIAMVTGLGYTFLSNGLTSVVARKLYKKAFKGNSLTVFQNPDDLELFSDLELVCRKRTSLIAGSGIDSNYFRGDPSNELKHQVLFVGRLLFDKGIRELLEGFSCFNKLFPGVKLVIVGDIDDGNPASLQESDIHRYDNGNICFLGFRDDVRNHISNSDVVILPSYREGLPRVILEGMSMSRPVIVTDVPGCRQTVVDGVNGFLIEARNSNSVKEGLIRFYQQNDRDRLQMGTSSREMVMEKFEASIINRQIVNEISSIFDSER